MYANVDQLGDLGSHVGAVSVAQSGFFYTVTFNRTITNCAAEVTPGYAGGHLQAHLWAAKAVYSGTKAFTAQIGMETDSGTKWGESAFMITVVCKS